MPSVMCSDFFEAQVVYLNVRVPRHARLPIPTWPFRPLPVDSWMEGGEVSLGVSSQATHFLKGPFKNQGYHSSGNTKQTMRMDI